MVSLGVPGTDDLTTCMQIERKIFFKRTLFILLIGLLALDFCFYQNVVGDFHVTQIEFEQFFKNLIIYGIVILAFFYLNLVNWATEVSWVIDGVIIPSVVMYCVFIILSSLMPLTLDHEILSQNIDGGLLAQFQHARFISAIAITVVFSVYTGIIYVRASRVMNGIAEAKRVQAEKLASLRPNYNGTQANANSSQH